MSSPLLCPEFAGAAGDTPLCFGGGAIPKALKADVGCDCIGGKTLCDDGRGGGAIEKADEEVAVAVGKPDGGMLLFKLLFVLLFMLLRVESDGDDVVLVLPQGLDCEEAGGAPHVFGGCCV